MPPGLSGRNCLAASGDSATGGGVLGVEAAAASAAPPARRGAPAVVLVRHQLDIAVDPVGRVALLVGQLDPAGQLVLDRGLLDQVMEDLFIASLILTS